MGPAKITVEFIKDNHKFRVERSLSKQKFLGSKLFRDGSLVEQNWNNVSAYIMDLMGVTRNSFEHVLYMSEGAAFRFLNSPLKEGITKEIEETLRIDTLERLLLEVQDEQKKYGDLENSILNEQKRLEDFTPVTESERLNLVEQLKQFDQQLENARKTVYDKTSQIAEARVDLSRFKDVVSRADQARSIIRKLSGSERFDEDYFAETNSTLNSLNVDYQNLQEQIMQRAKRKGMLEEQISSLEKGMQSSFWC